MRILLFGLVLLLTACGSPLVASPAPTPEAINVIYPPALQPWADRLSICASDNPLIALYFQQSNTVESNISANDIALEFGQTSQDKVVTNLSQVGWEQVVVVVNKDNSLSQLSTGELRLIFSGQESNWVDSTDQPIQVWVLPDGEPTRMIFDAAVMLTLPVTSEAMLAPDPKAMLEAISKDAGSIGFLLGSFLNTVNSANNSHIKIVQLVPDLESELNQPVIAVTQSEPKGLMRSLVVCLQSVIP